ncbi:ubiquitin-conjugating enzyme E2 1-like [Hippocampus zosterae]|uniref:ubiquitin-conjugating enzyme E2 1-like n=1 Tax=Hippocampus zosterae TaxID=109293 RepID=UPI00223DB878|nr:ubiquitin-conjugating enzyme E2 1-like [Hippocampus zosterae]
MSVSVKGRSKDIAYLRTADLTVQPFSIRRLVKDYIELEKERIPTVGVAAKPLDDNIFKWHANIKGPEGTPYEGGIFHLEIEFPQSYPHAPPKITLFTTLPHPNGWSSAYSVQSVLIQLQSFLFEESLEKDTSEYQKQVKLAIKNANEYKCGNRHCRHGGRLAAWPTFNPKEADLQEFIEMESPEEIFRREMICYHSKNPHTVNPVGVGIRVSKVPRTGLIKEAELFPYFISAKSFIKDFVRWSPNN